MWRTGGAATSRRAANARRGRDGDEVGRARSDPRGEHRAAAAVPPWRVEPRLASPTVTAWTGTRSLQPTAGVAVTDQDRVLLVRRADDGSWCLPGGRVEYGETVSECAQREFVEETGRSVDLTGLLGVYSRPDEQTHQYPDGTVVQFVAVVFTGTAGPEVGPLAGDTVEVQWFSSTELPRNLMACDAPIIRDALDTGRARPIIA